MKKLIFLFLSLLTVGSIFQACDDSKTYAEMLEDEKNAVNKFIKDSAIHVISQEEFEKQDSTTAVKGVNGAQYDEYVAFSNGIYMQVVKRGIKLGEDATAEEIVAAEKDVFVNNDMICVRYLEKEVATGEITSFNVFLEEWANASDIYASPAVFRYVLNELSSYSAGTFVELNFLWVYGTAVPQGWLLALPYIRNGAHVRLIVPSKMGHQQAQQDVLPFYYDIQDFSKAKS